MKKAAKLPGPEAPYVTAKTLSLLYPELEKLLDTVPNRLEDNVRVYNAFIALDVVNALRKEIRSQNQPPDAELDS
ncbi:MAG TPA: hypothetical protein VKQ72_00555 [Aggregatilineales bacterium]|nr:hypothetical protein [Aggregatilineales bacterium]